MINYTSIIRLLAITTYETIQKNYHGVQATFAVSQVMSPTDSSSLSLTSGDLNLNRSSTSSELTSLHSLPVSTTNLHQLAQNAVSTAVPEDYDYSAQGQPIPSNSIILGVCMFVVVGVTFTANLFVLASFIAEKKLRTTFAALIANLALVDLLVAVTAFDFYTISVMYGYWPLGEIMCGIWVVMDHVTVLASCFTLSAIGVDRMWSITWSISYRRYNTLGKAAGFIAAIW